MQLHTLCHRRVFSVSGSDIRSLATWLAILS